MSADKRKLSDRWPLDRWLAGCVMSESLWKDGITSSNVKEMVLSRAVCWRTAVGQKSRGLAWNFKEMLKDRLEHIWKDREVWSSSQWWRGMFRWMEKSYLSCVLNSVFADTAPTSRWRKKQTPILLMCFHWFICLACQVDFTLLSIAQLVFCREDKGNTGVRGIPVFFPENPWGKEIFFTTSSLRKGCIILYE